MRLSVFITILGVTGMYACSVQADTDTFVIDVGSEDATDEVDDCTPNPCNDGLCSVTGEGYVCDCTGTGYSGSQCTDNINECETNISGCSPYAACEDTIGSVECECELGYSGPGFGGDGCCRDDNPLVLDEAGNTVMDPGTGLTWERDPEPGMYNHAQAMDRCSLRGLRLPTREELESIADARFTPTWMPCTFREGDSSSLWTSTTVGSQSAFIVHFSFGGTGNDVVYNMYGALCVHD